MAAMDNVSLSVPPEDPADIYIPTIQASHDQSPPPSTAGGEHPVQLPTIRYTPSSSNVPPPLVAANTRAAAIVAATDPTAPAFFQYRTTTFTQVHFAAAQAFSYPPTPPLDGPCNGDPERAGPAGEHQQPLAITQAPHGLDYNENHHTAPGQINPFPSLPTPPDIEALQQQQQQQSSAAHGGPPPLASDADGTSSPIATTSPHSLKPNGVGGDINIGSASWQQQGGHPASNICFVPPGQHGVSPQMFQFNTHRASPSVQPAIYYPAAAAVSMQQPNQMGQLHNGGCITSRAVPPLVKGLDGKLE